MGQLSCRVLLSAIRRKCLDCAGGNREEVEGCTVRDCPLHPFRLAVEQGVLPGTAERQARGNGADINSGQ